MVWPMARRVERRARRMQEIIRRLDVDAPALARLRQGDAYAEAFNSCLACGTSDKCLRWLDQAQPTNQRPSFCPNLSLFESLKRDRSEQGQEGKPSLEGRQPRAKASADRT